MNKNINLMVSDEEAKKFFSIFSPIKAEDLDLLFKNLQTDESFLFREKCYNSDYGALKADFDLIKKNGEGDRYS